MLRSYLRHSARAFAWSVMTVSALCAPQVAAGGTPPPPPMELDASVLLGVYQGDVQGSSSMCPDPQDNEVFAAPMLITLDQSGSARGGFVTGDGDTGSIAMDLLAMNSVSGQASGRSPDGSTFNITFSGSFLESQGKLSLSFSGLDSLGCNLSGNIVVTRVDVTFVDPTNTSPSVVLNGQNAENTGRFASGLANIVRTRRQSSGEGMMRHGNGALIQGEAAGSHGAPIGVWAGYSRTSTEDDFATTAFTDTRHDFLLGVDTSFDGGNTLVGVAFGLQTGDTTTKFNGGSQNLTAITIAPYVGMLLTDWLSFDATVGYSDVQIDQSRTAAGTGATITSDVESMRFFGAINLAATYRMDNLLLTGLGGMTWATQRDDSFRESGGLLVAKSSSDVGRFLFGGEAAYSHGAWEPYVRALVEYDFTKTRVNFAPGVAAPKNDDLDVLAGFGLRYFGDNGVSGSVEYSTLFGRSNLDEDTISANVRWTF